MLTKIFAHRGASQLAPENTMPAFKLAYELGADGIETDVQLTKDFVPVLIHDEHIKRTTNGYGYIKDYTFNELTQFDAGSWFSKKYAGISIVSLNEFLQWIKSKPLQINIELKNNKINYQHLEEIVYGMIDDYQLQDRTILSTFNKHSVKRMKKFTDVEVALLSSTRKNKLIALAKETGANALHIKYRLLTSKFMRQAKKENIAIRVYTVNKRAKMMKCFFYQCDGIFTDVPDLGLKYRKLFSFTKNTSN